MIINKAKLGIGLLAVTLALGAGSVAAAGPLRHTGTAGGGDRTARCEAYQAKLAQNLGITVAKLRDARKATLNGLIDDRQTAGTITADQAKKLHDRVNAGDGGCARAGQAAGAAATREQIGRAELRAVALKLNITERELVKELRSGKSLAQIATDKGVSRADLKATMTAAYKAELDKAVAGGTITQAQADTRLAAFTTRLDALIDRQGFPRPGKGKS